AAAAVDNDSPSGRGVSRGAVEVSCGAGGALRVRPAAESEWLTCGAGSRVSACGKYADLCRQRTARRATRRKTIVTTTTNTGQPKAVMAADGGPDVPEWNDFLGSAIYDYDCFNQSKNTSVNGMNCTHWKTHGKIDGRQERSSGSDLDRQAPLQEEELLEQKEARDDLKNDAQQNDQSQVANAGKGSHREQSSTNLENPEKAAKTAPQSVENAVDGTVLQNTSVLLSTTESAPEEGSTTSTASTNENTGTSATAADMDVSPKTEIEETTSTTPPSTENTTTQAPTTTPSPLPKPEITNNITSTVKNKASVDSSVNPVWMRTAAPLLIVGVLFFFTVC
ncbi:uncharacterized protein TM35_001111040, partial [Trypanosoma theileri]